MSRKIVEIVNGVARHPLYRMREPINFVLHEGEQLAIVGPNGGGKTILINTIIGSVMLWVHFLYHGFARCFPY